MRKIFKLSFEIIGYSGNAKDMVFEVIGKAKERNISEARVLLKEFKEEVDKNDKSQTELTQREFCWNKIDVSVVLIYAQDHLINTINY